MLTDAQKYLDKINSQLLEVLELKKAHEEILYKTLKNRLEYFDNPNIDRFYSAFSNRINIKPSEIDCKADWIRIGKSSDLSPEETDKLLCTLKGLKPWRKGPFNFFDIKLDAEWRSDYKWNRIKEYLPDLTNKTILDVGCSSGYYMFRMLEYNPKLILGIDPSDLFFFQFQLLQNYIQAPNVFYSPIRMADILPAKNYFDVVFCMGILYHQKHPINALKELKNVLKKQGTLVLETIVIPGNNAVALSPWPTYAKMNNVFFLPTAACLKNWLLRAGFHNICIISKNRTKSEEQRKTEWIETESLSDFLDKNNQNKTIEGYPAPIRLSLLARPL
jgi:tRNA (mo5U34)-methyltransferase